MGLALIVAISVLATATLSGIFGMGGGMILMGVYAMTLPLASAMILHGVTQLGANGFRALLLRRQVRWAIAARVGLGAVIALAFLTWLQASLDLRAVFLVLGAIPLVVLLLPPSLNLTVEQPIQAVLCGFVFTALQLVAGASGPILDAFFLRGTLTRFEIVATKATIGSLGHITKLLYWGLLLREADRVSLPTWLLVLAVLSALVGTRLGKFALVALRETQFQRYSRVLVIAIASVYLVRGLY